MSRTRVYLPLSEALLRRLAVAGEIGSPPVRAHAVTPALLRSRPGASEEELEYAALCEAAAAAGRLRGRPGERRAVAAADVESESVHAPALDRGQAASQRPCEGVEARGRGDHPRQWDSSVDVRAVVPLRGVVSLHVKEAGAAEGAELLWYDVTELDELIRSL